MALPNGAVGARGGADDPEKERADDPARGIGRRLVWFAALWLAGVGSLALLAFVLRWAIGA